MTAQELNPSIELLDAIRVIQQKYGESKDLVYNAYKLAIRDGFSPIQARDFLFAELPFLSERTIRMALPDEAKDQSKNRTILPTFAANLPQKPEQNKDNVVNITTKATIQDADLVEKDIPTEEEDPKDIEIAFLKEQKAELTDQLQEEKTRREELEYALHKTQQFIPGTQLESNANANAKPVFGIDDDTVFNYLKDRAKETGDILDFGRVGSGALVQVLTQYKGSFGVVELFGRIVKK